MFMLKTFFHHLKFKKKNKCIGILSFVRSQRPHIQLTYEILDQHFDPHWISDQIACT